MRLLSATLLGFALAAAASAQTTFTITLASKSSEHPYSGQGHPSAYVLDGAQAPGVTLVRGRTYTFQLSGVSGAHPFYLSTSSEGAGAAPFAGGVSGNGATGNGSVTITVPMSAPDVLWYQCQNHSFMGWRMNVVSATDVAGVPPGLAFERLAANPAAGEARFGLTLPEPAAVRVEAFAADGRRVAVLFDGALAGGVRQTVALDTRALAAGVYIVRVTGAGWRLSERVAVAR